MREEQMMEKHNEIHQEMMEKYGDYIKQAKQLRFLSNPHAREITANLKKKHGSSGLICPCCGEGDHGNIINGKRVCYMTSKHKAKGIDGPVLLMSPEKAEDWEPPKKTVMPKEMWELNKEEIVRVKRR